MRFPLALLMVLHGFAHLVGFAGSWKLSSNIAYKTTVLGGHVDLGDTGIHALGLLWLANAAAFAVAGIALALRASWWHPFAVGVTLVSLALCVVELPAAKIGAVLNVAILVVLVAGRKWLA